MRCRQFTIEDQIAFAALSGDNNPLHLDPLVARRTLFGQPVVHGVHALMWALDQWLESACQPVRLSRLQVAFQKPIGLNQEVQFRLVSEANKRVRIDLVRADEVVTRILFEWLACEPVASEIVLQTLPKQQPPENLTQEAIQGSSGRLNLHLQPELAHELLPNLAQFLCPEQSAVLLGTTYLVGVKCPGLHSIFSELRLASTATKGSAQMSFAVSEVDDRFGLVLIAVEAPGLEGTIKAFLRPPPQAQASYLDLKKMVVFGEFSGQQALVVGGSRGLGEVAAKLLAAGGAKVQISYRSGRADAQKIVDEILANSGQASLLPLDVLEDQKNWSGLMPPSHLYYFASPFISGSGKTFFSPVLFQKFCDYYVTGLAQLVEALREHGLQNVFYPSTVFLDELPSQFVEYALAKGAGEILCDALRKRYPEIEFACPRLPKLATDQTVSLQSAAPDPNEVILSALRQSNRTTVP